MPLKKIFYVPGTISLLIVPFLFLYLLRNDISKHEVVLKLFLPRDQPDKNGLLSFNGPELLAYIKPLKKTEIYLDGDDFIKYQKLDFIFHEMQRISFSNKNEEALVVHMNKENNWGDFVKILDMANCTGIKRYAFWGNEWFFIGNNPPLPPSQELLLFTCGCCDTQINTFTPNLLELTKAEYKKLKENKGLYLIMGWIILVLVSIIKRKNSQAINFS